MLLLVVYAAFLILMGVSATGLAVLVGAHYSTGMLNTTAAHDRALVGLWADSNVGADELSSGFADPERRAQLEAMLSALAGRSGMVHIELRDVAGRLLLSNRPDHALGVVSGIADYDAAVSGQTSARLIGEQQAVEAVAGLTGPVLQEYMPLVKNNGEVAALVGIWRDARPTLAQLDAMRGDILLMVSVGAGVLAVVLLFVFRAANRRLDRQNAALLETTRRDPLTGMLNHGAAVAGLAERVETARRAGAELGVALIDIDNFRLLNETHGHVAGDSVLREVAELIGQMAPAGCLTGRYGPDEFIVVGPPVATEAVAQLVEQVRDGLRAVSVRFGDSEALPVTVSAGLATFPAAARSVTDLLVVAATAVHDAKASGGDVVRGADGAINEPAPHTTFNALQGLIFAVDTKDHYTRRHSEDVARYAVFLGRQLGLAADQLEQLRLSGLLHDVGKVGIPDAILRKPAALTTEERDIVAQHVALGDLIVRDLPDIDIVRRGVRYHHERWDGGGYLDHLAGAEIPEIARILAVCDSFSAMSTTRPYRKSMSVAEALKRLGDAAGSQLDERIVATFVHAMDSVGDAPQPEDESPRGRLWLPATAT